MQKYVVKRSGRTPLAFEGEVLEIADQLGAEAVAEEVA